MSSVLTAALTLAALEPALPCSTFANSGDGPVFFGRNADVAFPLPGLLIVNKRGVSKTAMQWSVIGPAPHQIPVAHWVSRYGSVTVTAVGREFPDGGMNEAGLAVEEMSLLATVYPSGSDRPTIPQPQWLQYQLDNYSTVAQVVSHLNDFAITGWGWHFMVADASGDCARIEFLAGKPVAERGEKGMCVLTNSTIAESKQYATDGAGKEIPAGIASLPRYARLSKSLVDFKKDDRAMTVDDAFRALASVADPKYTVRTTVHDLTHRIIYFRSIESPEIKIIDLKRLDFAADTPVLMLSTDAPVHGDVTDRFVPYTEAANRYVVDQFFARVVHKVPAGEKVFEAELKAAGITEAKYLDSLARYPDTLAVGG